MEDQIENDLEKYENSLRDKRKHINPELAKIKSKIDTNRPLRTHELKAQQLEEIKEQQQAAIVKAKFRKIKQK